MNNDNALNTRLIANSKTAQLSYSNGKYGFTIDGTFYELGGGSGMQKNYLIASNQIFKIDISELSNTTELVFGGFFPATGAVGGETATVATVKTWTSAHSVPTPNPMSVIYSNGILSITSAGGVNVFNIND